MLPAGGLFPRSELVTSLYQQVLEQGFVLVRCAPDSVSLSVLTVEQVGGTPGSGKSTLLFLLQEHVRNADVRSAVMPAIRSWKPKEESRLYYVRSMCTSS